VNKIDRLRDKRLLLPFIDTHAKSFEFSAVVPISAKRSDNLESLIGEIRARLPEGLLYAEDFFTDRPERFFVAELVREAAIERTREEVPHGIACVIDQYVERGGTVHVSATIVVEKESHKAIVIGAQGRAIKEIGIAARTSIEAFVGSKVFLELWVKVVPGWTGNPAHAKRLATEIEQP
jgi:GTP-binding protein Era